MLDDGALEQATNLANLPCTQRHIALMPDAHQGFGMPIGGVIFTDGAVIPNAVGVDIGCGVAIMRLNGMHASDLNKVELRMLIDKIAERIPTGFSRHEKGMNMDAAIAYMGETSRVLLDGDVDPEWFRNSLTSLGTLGGGNHFIEVQEDEDGSGLYIMLHSGSRGLGKAIGDFYHKEAVKLCERWHTPLPTSDLAFFPLGEPMHAKYMNAMNFGLAWAEANRNLMLDAIKEILRDFPCSPEVLVNVHHNYASWEHHFGMDGVVHRKGAIRARKGETLLIPGSMGTASYIGKGLGNPDSYNTCQHGAGRARGRKQTERESSVEELAADMAAAGVLMGGKAATAVDEGPRAYKDIEQVMLDSADLVQPMVRLRPIGVVKG
jgi:tRNA-splicing ligase RtcB